MTHPENDAPPVIKPPSEEQLFFIRENAKLVIRMSNDLVDFDFGYTEESLQWFAGYIDRLRNGGLFSDPKTFNKYASVFASYFGEVIIHAFGGEWKYYDGELAIILDGKDWVFPFSKVTKQMENEDGDSIFGLYQILPFRDKLRQAKNMSS